jgi:hypothetical protein
MEMNIREKEMSGTQRSRRPNLIRKLFFGAVIAFVVVGLYFFKSNSLSQVSDGYQAVFLSNGQVYFGKLEQDGGWLVLNDIYYLQASDSLQQKTVPTENNNLNQNVQLVKLGTELHGPEDMMFIERDKVLFWENLKEDSKVVEAIQKDKSN